MNKLDFDNIFSSLENITLRWKQKGPLLYIFTE